MSIIHTRTQSKYQNVVNIHFHRVNFLAHSAVQHMLLKLSAFPQDAYDAGVLSLGFCPFRGVQFSITGAGAGGEADDLALEQFIGDVRTDDFQWVIDQQINLGADFDNEIIEFNPDDWSYRIDEIDVVSAYFNPGERENVLSTQIVVIADNNFERAGLGNRTEKLTKTLQITGRIE